MTGQLPRAQRSSRRGRRKAAERRTVGTAALLAAAVVGYAVALGVAAGAWHLAEAELRQAAMQRAGAALADDLASAAVEPMARQDRIRLGVLAQAKVDQPGVARVAVYTVDDRPFVDVGGAPARLAPSYTGRIKLQDSELGYVRVTMDPDGYGMTVEQLVELTWGLWLGGLAVTIGAVLCRGAVARWFALFLAPAQRMSRRRRSPPADREEVFVLAVGLAGGDEIASYARERVLGRALAAAERVADRYDAEAAALPGVGIAVEFPAPGASDRAFSAAFAALLLRRLLHDQPWPEEFEAAWRGGAAPFGYALDLVGRDVGDAATHDDESAESVGELMRLATLAPGAGVIIGHAAYAALERAERLLIQEFARDDAGRHEAPPAHGVVRDTASEYQGPLAREAETIASLLR